MANDADAIPARLAGNLVALRRARGISQAQLAAQAGVPRSTIAHIETGAGNPSLHNLTRLAAALGVGIDELLSERPTAVRLTAADAVARESRGVGVTVIHLLRDPARGVEIDRIELAAAATMRGQPHLGGTHEYLMPIAGRVRVAVGRTWHDVEAGAVLAFPGDQPHSYRNPDREPASAISVVLPVVLPVPAPP